MKVVILAGGYGTRISEESRFKPKPMIEIGGLPIIWHIMKLYSYYGFNEFIICAGYMQQIIKEWFSNYFLYTSDVVFDFRRGNEVNYIKKEAEPWKVAVIDTGLETMTGGRLKRVKEYIGEETFLMTYGDGVSNINIAKLIKFHKSHNCLATMTAIQPESRYGNIDLQDGIVTSFREKSSVDTGWINGGFMVLEPDVLDYIADESTMFEREPLEKLSSEGKLACYQHTGFWQCMDTLRDKQKLEQLWIDGMAPWKVW